MNDFYKYFMAFPYAATLSFQLAGDSDPNLLREEKWEAKRQLHIALYRALQSKSTPVTIKTSDLLSPFDGKPLRYAYDGRQMSFTVSDSSAGPDEQPLTLKFPPDSAILKLKP